MDENPSAFPLAIPGDCVSQPEYGMTLRDWFAGQALATVYDSYSEAQLKAWFGEKYGLSREQIRARAAYAMAEAMLAERKIADHG